MSVKKPNDIYEFCDSFKLPYASAKQYFDSAIIHIDFYKDTSYFYEWYTHLDSKDKDTVYNNLAQIYEVTKKQSNDTLSALTAIMPTSYETTDLEEFKDKMTKTADSFKKICVEMETSRKLSIIAEFLSTIDTYKRMIGSMNRQECELNCLKFNSRLDETDNRYSSDIRWSVLVSVLVTCLISTGLIG